jgi:hypothetical protein
MKWRENMTDKQEKSITLALNILYVGFFECPKHYFEYFVNNDEWGLLMAAAGVNDVSIPPQRLALAVVQQAVAREGFFSGMTDFEPPAHYCSFLKEKIDRGERRIPLQQCKPGQQDCPYATFEHLKASKQPPYLNG